MPDTSQELLPEITTNPEVLSFSGHETFVFRYGWLKKAVDAATADPQIFTFSNAIVILGVGKNMVKSIRHWALATGVLFEEARSRGTVLHATEIGNLLFATGGLDQHLEDPNSLWLIHWNLITNPHRSTTWRWAFNLFPSNEFTKESLTHAIRDEVVRRGAIAKMPSETTLKRDVDIFLRTYIPAKQSSGAVAEDTLDCPLVELQLIEEITGTGIYQLRRGPKETLSDLIFAYALADFWDRVAPGRESMAFNDIAYEQGSPGSTFKLDENSLVERLDRLDDITEGALIYTETAGLKQVYRRRQRSKFEYLVSYYQETNPLYVVGV